MALERKLLFLLLTFILAMSLIRFSTLKAQELQSKNDVLKIEILEKSLRPDFLEDLYVTEVFFAEGRDQLSTMTKSEIINNYYQANRDNKVIAAKIFTAADSIVNSKEQIGIIEKRNDRIESILEELDLQLKVKKFNLAEDERFLLKKASEKDREILDSMKKNPQFLSRSIVYFELE